MHFRLIAPSGQVLESGDGVAGVEGGALVVTPRSGQPLRVRPRDVAAISEPVPYVVRLELNAGPALELSQLGAMRTQLLADLTAVRGDDTVQALLLGGVGTPATFTGSVDGVDAEIRLYDDLLVTVPVRGAPVQVRYAFLDDVRTDGSGYRISIDAGSVTVEVHRLGSLTSEFLAALRDRVAASRSRSAALVNRLLPGLGSLAQRSVAGLLRDGVPARCADLDAVEPGVSAALLRVCTRSDRVAGVQALAGRGELYLAVHQRSSVEVAGSIGADLGARSVQVVTDHGDHHAAPGGIAGVLTGELLRAGPDPFGFGTGAPLGLLGMAVLGGPSGMAGLYGGNAGQPSAQVGREHPRSGVAQAPRTDYQRLGVTGDSPSVLAMLYTVIATDGAVVYEVLNDGAHATYVYDPPPGGVHALASTLSLIGFRVAGVYSDADGADSQYRDAVARLPPLAQLRAGFRGRAIHGPDWESQLAGLLAR